MPAGSSPPRTDRSSRPGLTPLLPPGTDSAPRPSTFPHNPSGGRPSGPGRVRLLAQPCIWPPVGGSGTGCRTSSRTPWIWTRFGPGSRTSSRTTLDLDAGSGLARVRRPARPWIWTRFGPGSRTSSRTTLDLDAGRPGSRTLPGSCPRITLLRDHLQGCAGRRTRIRSDGCPDAGLCGGTYADPVGRMSRCRIVRENGRGSGRKADHFHGCAGRRTRRQTSARSRQHAVACS